MMGLYTRFGFERILGLGHFLWIPVLPVVVLAIPAVDVWKHFSGARQATR